jgi:hypothetical protein
MELVKYSRTPHLPWSQGRSSDDIETSDSQFAGMNIVVTEKMDGECTTMTSVKCHARSLDSNNHPSRNWVKNLWSGFKYDMPDDIRIVGENLYAKHSIGYDDLRSFFYVFGIYAFEGVWKCLSWKETLEYCHILNLDHVNVLFEGKYEDFKHIEMDWEKHEGYVIRNADSFPESEFGQNVAKFVRKGHVQTEDHWMNQVIVANKLK